MKTSVLTVAELIEHQRKLASAPHPKQRLLDAAVAAGNLRDRLALLADPQIGQLLWEYVVDAFGICAPQTTICLQAVHRLFRSPGQEFTQDDFVHSDSDDLPLCPQCNSEMLFNFGVDETDFWQCCHVGCRYKMHVESIGRRPVGENKPWQ